MTKIVAMILVVLMLALIEAELWPGRKVPWWAAAANGVAVTAAGYLPLGIFVSWVVVPVAVVFGVVLGKAWLTAGEMFRQTMDRERRRSDLR